MKTVSLCFSERVGNLGDLLVTIRFLLFMTGTLERPGLVEYDPMTGIMATAGTKLPTLLVGTTLGVLPNMISS